MNQLRILLHDGSSLILHEDELFNEIVFVLDDFRNDDDYLTIEKRLWQRTCIEQRLYSWD